MKKAQAQASIAQARAAQAKSNAISPYAGPPPANRIAGFSSAIDIPVPMVCEHCEEFGHVGSACRALQGKNCLGVYQPTQGEINRSRATHETLATSKAQKPDRRVVVVAGVSHCGKCLRTLGPDEYACKSCVTQTNLFKTQAAREQDCFIGRLSPLFAEAKLPICFMCDAYGTVLDFDRDVVMANSTWACTTFPIRALACCDCPILNKDGNLNWMKYPVGPAQRDNNSIGYRNGGLQY